jgi:hypothetical protein
MPVNVKTVRQAGSGYALPFLGPHTDYTVQIDIDVTALTDDEIDQDGYLKPGTPFDIAGALVGASPAFVYGVSIEPIKVAEGNDAASIAAASDAFQIAVLVIGIVNRDAVEDNLGRALTANEIAGFDRAGSKLVLTAT